MKVFLFCFYVCRNVFNNLQEFWWEMAGVGVGGLVGGGGGGGARKKVLVFC